ncbi:MAG: alpha-hydroxy-acid oxidizing protein [Anaerolineales bacterium]|nr:MAG: alpha-hydroxy-acid oxidizing protein [Anaerolineales bacterium]
MHAHSRYHITTAPAPAPAGGYPAQFHFDDGGAYVKYGHQVFLGSNQRGDEYWTAEIVSQTWYMAETGRIPISGAGYGGKFAGQGFEGIWLDMSEIVRPTRDGIHGREYISTQVDLGAGLMRLEFDPSGRLRSTPPPALSLPLPVLFNPLPMPLPGEGALRAVSQAAAELGTLAVLYPQEYGLLEQQADWLGLRVTPEMLPQIPPSWQPRYIEIESHDLAQVLPLYEQIIERWPEAVCAALLPLSSRAPEMALAWVEAGLPVLHLYADEVGRDLDGSSLPESLQQVHKTLVGGSLRDQVTLLVSGGIAAAEHVAKAIACGADLLAVDFALQIAWGCSLWADRGRCPVESDELDPDWGAQRVVNLMNAWRDQLLEALGAMGMREVRRLRGEVGRTIWHTHEETAFRKALGGSASLSRYPLLPQPAGGEGDFRWPTALLLASQAQARTGRPPSGELEHRLGASAGGFDRLAFAFELDRDPLPVISTDPSRFDFRLPLNRRDPGRPARLLPVPWYGAGMSYGSIGLPVMLSRARAAQALGTLTSTGEGGYPDELIPYAGHIITQVATGLFGVSEASLQRAPVIEIKYAQGAKPGLGGHLLGNKNTDSVARLREAVEGTSLFSPFPFHSVYSVEDHKKHVDWLKQVSPQALISVKVSTPTDVDMVAVGSYYAGAHIIHLDGAYGGTGAAPEIAKKNIAMPIEYALPKVHRFLVAEGIRAEVTLMASGGLRSAWDVAKAIALGADGAILGTAELVAIGCIRIAQCEKGLGCPFGITTTDPEHAQKIDADVGFQQIVNLYTSWLWQLAGILDILGMRSIAELRGRSDLLVYLEG